MEENKLTGVYTEDMKDVTVSTFDFRTIRQCDMVYVDKTEYAYRLARSPEGSFFFMSRPRRFGKSLFCSTLHELFEGNRELFEGLYITEKTDYGFGKYPVIHFSFSRLTMLREFFLSDLQETIEYIQRMTNNGGRFRNDALSTYLEKARDHCYHSQIIKALYSPAGRISPAAITNYVLFGKDDGTKVQNLRAFSSQCSVPLGTSGCQINHLGHTITCSLIQGYVLATGDSEPTAIDIVNMMKDAGARLNPVIRADQTDMKFKKYAVDNKDALGMLSRKLCEDNKVFSFLF